MKAKVKECEVKKKWQTEKFIGEVSIPNLVIKKGHCFW